MIISLDTETTISNKGNPFDSTNRLCMVGVYDGEEALTYDIEYTDTPYGREIEELRSSILSADLVVFFNAKFDLNWLRNYGIDYPTRIWDCQLVHFILTNQTHPYPSLNEVSEYYGLGSKIDKIAEYWENKVDTPDIPEEELREYLKQDIKLTLEIYYKQLEEIQRKPHLNMLINLSNQDTLVLADMEYNGLKYDFNVSEKNAAELREELDEINEELNRLVPIAGINWGSGDHLSAILYGGIVKVPYREVYTRELKGGRIKICERNSTLEIPMPRLVEPLEGSECKKEGYWKVGEDVLLSLKTKGQAKNIIEQVLRWSLVDKELNTYAEGLPKKYRENNYTGEYLHGRLNQCVARTGRLSSSEPNMQNISGKSKGSFITRF